MVSLRREEVINLALGLGSEDAFLGFGLEDMYCFFNDSGNAMLQFLGGATTRLLGRFAGVFAELIHLRNEL